MEWRGHRTCSNGWPFERQTQSECASLSRLAFNADAGAMQFRKTLCQGQAKSGPFLTPSQTTVQLLKLGEAPTKVCPCTPDAVVPHTYLHPRTAPATRNWTP